MTVNHCLAARAWTHPRDELSHQSISLLRRSRVPYAKLLIRPSRLGQPGSDPVFSTSFQRQSKSRASSRNWGRTHALEPMVRISPKLWPYYVPLVNVGLLIASWLKDMTSRAMSTKFVIAAMQNEGWAAARVAAAALALTKCYTYAVCLSNRCRPLKQAATNVERECQALECFDSLNVLLRPRAACTDMAFTVSDLQSWFTHPCLTTYNFSQKVSQQLTMGN